MTGVVVIGASGHAKVCIDLLRASGHSVDYCIGAPGGPDRCLGVAVLEGDDQLARLRDEQGYSQVFVAIGDNQLRLRLAEFAATQGFQLVNAVSPEATISPTVRLGSGVAVMAGAVVNAETEIGSLAIINTLASVDHDGKIGEAAHVAPHVGLAGNVTIGARTFLGLGSKVIPEISIGADVIAAAGSVIVSDIEAGSRIAGVPAKPMEARA